MGYNVGKAAENAVQMGQVKKKEVRTAEQAIRTLRELRAAHLHVSPNDVDLLLAEYDRQFDALAQSVADNVMLKTAKDFLLEENERLIAEKAEEEKQATEQAERNLQLRKAEEGAVVEMKKALPLLQELLDKPLVAEAMAAQGFEIDPDAVKKLESEIRAVKEVEVNNGD